MTTANQTADRTMAREPVIPNSVLGMLLFLATEAMLFAALISSFVIAKSSFSTWPPVDQFRLPLAETGFNTFMLLASGVFLFFAGRSFARKGEKTRILLLTSILLGAFFVILQGSEWVTLLGQGLTMHSSTFGGFFYLIVGMHALHAIVALGVLIGAYRRLGRGTLTNSGLWMTRVLWYFVVGLWPVLYYLVYL